MTDRRKVMRIINTILGYSVNHQVFTESCREAGLLQIAHEMAAKDGSRKIKHINPAIWE